MVGAAAARQTGTRPIPTTPAAKAAALTREATRGTRDPDDDGVTLADALRGLGIDLDVVDYNEHTIGTNKDAKAATYIGCVVAGGSQKVWGVGIHTDVVQASLIALLSAASSVWVHDRDSIWRG